MESDARLTKAGGPAVRAFLATASAAWRSVLGRNLSGVYVSGSLSTGAFNLRTSDIDVVVATRAQTDAAANERIAELHLAMLGWGGERWAERLEVLFTPVKALRSHGVPDLEILELHPDEGFKVERLGADFILQKRMLREHGITLYGPKIARIVAPVTADELREAVLGNLRDWWRPQLEFPGQFLKRGYQAYAVLTMCRALCLLATGDLVTKPEAAAWALRGPYLDVWHPLIESAIAYPGGAQPDERRATLDFIRFTLDEAGVGHSAPSS
jgi:hypothetical protein